MRMVILYSVFFLLLSFGAELSAAASSNDGMSNLNKSDDTVIAIPSHAQSSTPSPRRGSHIRLRRGISAVGPDLTFALGLTQEHYDVAQNQILTQLNQVGLSTPRTDRSKHALLEQIGREITRQKTVLAGSAGADLSSSLDDSTVSSSTENLTNEELNNLVISQQIANQLLTQITVQQQDDREQTEERLRSANFRANLEGGFAVLSLVVAIALGLVPIIMH